MFAEDLKSYIKAGQPLIYVTALELPRASQVVGEVCKSLNGEGYPYHEWKVTTGWDGTGSGDDPAEVFDWIDKFDDLSVCVLFNFHGFIGENPDGRGFVLAPL